jgi:glycosyl transferase family 25
MKNVANAGFTDIKVSDAIDGYNLDSVTNSQNTLGDKCVFDMETSPGIIGCLLSHLMVWKKIVDEDIKIATVFEDDVHFHPEWTSLSERYFKNTPGDFDIIFIGNGLDSCRLERNTAPEVNTESAWCTHAYIITKKGASRMMDAILNWDYANFDHNGRGKTLSGLYTIDIMIKDTQNNILLNRIPKSFTWYCWNGTYYPCEHNKLPVKGNDSRNTGLVFQNTNIFRSSTIAIGSFFDENSQLIDITGHETTEQWIADTFIEPDAKVLELGGRYGVVSYKINNKLNNKRNHVVVEPDSHVFRALQRNLMINSADPILYNGTITRERQYIEFQGLATRTRCEPCSVNSVIVPHKSLSKLIEETGIEFDTLVADCEGCLGTFFDENLDYIPRFKMITFESDFHTECDYDKIKRIMIDNNFVEVRPGGHSVWKREYRKIEIVPKNDTPIVKQRKLIWNKVTIK